MIDDGDVAFRQNDRGMTNYGAIIPHNSVDTENVPRPTDTAGLQVCPTCRGKGHIRKDQEHELVALIPLKDSRLKPRRTVVYVSLAVGLCTIVGGLLMFFLLPRTVVVSSDVRILKPMATNISVQNQYVLLTIRNDYNISNENFIPITVSKMEVRVLFDAKMMSDVINETVLQVPIRSTRIYSVYFNITFTEDNGYLAYYCSRPSSFGHTIWMPFQATATSSYYGHTEETTLDYMQQVKCSGKSID